MIGNILAGALYKAPIVGDFESIATVTVGSGGAADISFTNIGTTWQHLQLRLFVQSNRAATNDGLSLRFNSDTGSNYYAGHILSGDGTNAASSVEGTGTFIYIQKVPGTTNTNIFGAHIIDILDYQSVNKNKTVRIFGGMDINTSLGTFGIALTSGLWKPTTPVAITSITLDAVNGTGFTNYSHVALYGIKG